MVEIATDLCLGALDNSVVAKLETTNADGAWAVFKNAMLELSAAFNDMNHFHAWS